MDLGKRKVAFCLLKEKRPEVVLGVFSTDRRDAVVQAHIRFYEWLFSRAGVNCGFLLYEEAIPGIGWQAYGWIKMAEAALLARLPITWGYSSIEVSRLRKLLGMSREEARKEAEVFLKKAKLTVLACNATGIVPVRGKTASSFARRYHKDMLDAVILARGAQLLLDGTSTEKKARTGARK